MPTPIEEDAKPDAAPAAEASAAAHSIDDGDHTARKRLIWTIACWLAVSIALPLIPYRPEIVTVVSPRFLAVLAHSHLPMSWKIFLAELPSSPVYIGRMTLFHFLPSLPFLLLQILIGLRIVQMRWQVKAAILAIVASVIVWFALLPLDIYLAQHHGRLITLLAHTTPLLFNLSLTIGFSCIGLLLSRIVREPNVLLPVSLVAMPIDYIGAMTPVGFTNTMVARHPHAVSQVMVHVPHLSGLPLESMIGPGDILFIAFFFAAIERMKLNVRGTLWTMSALLSLTLYEVILVGYPIAALVPMGIAVIGANARHFRLRRAEVFAMIYAAIVVCAVVGVFYYYAHRALTR